MSENDKSTMTRAELHKNDNLAREPKKHHFLRNILIVLILLLIGFGTYAGYTYFRAKNAVDKTYDSKNAVNVDPGFFDGKNPVSILLLGTDTGKFGRSDEISNTDTIIVATIDAQNKRSALFSVPRDTMAEMIGTSSFNVQKINAAYSIGKAKMAMNTVSALVNVPLKYYVEVNMAGLEKIVNAVDGVDVQVPFTFSYGGYTFTKGPMHLNGAQALAYARMRYDDPENDYGRQKRQRQVIKSIVKNAISLNTVKNLETILDSFEDNVRTNLTFNNMISIMRNYTSAADNMKSDYLHGTPAFIGDASYQIMATTELQRISDLIREQMGLETETLDNNETYQNEQNTTFDWHSGVYTQPFTIYSKSNPGVIWNGAN